MRIRSIDYGNAVIQAGLAAQVVHRWAVVEGESGGVVIGLVEGVGQRTGRGLRMRMTAALGTIIGVRRSWILRGAWQVHGAAESYRDAIFPVVDAPAVGENVNIGAFGAELAISLHFVISKSFPSTRTSVSYFGKVLANNLGRCAEIMAEWACVAGLARALTKELARNVSSV